LAHVHGASLDLLGIILEVLAGIARKLTPGALELAFHLLGLGIQVGFVLNWHGRWDHDFGENWVEQNSSDLANSFSLLALSKGTSLTIAWLWALPSNGLLL
jgi:hypothetical protein